jgi:PAS domain S-box-containing protein
MGFQKQEIISAPNVGAELLSVLSPDGFFISGRPALQRILGWVDAEYLGKHILNFVHSDNVFQIKKSFVQISDGETLFLEPVNFMAKDGQYHSLVISLVPMFRQGDLVEILCLGEAILENDPPSSATNRYVGKERRVPNFFHKEPATFMNFLETLLADTPIGFGFFDESFNYICVNQSLAAMNGYAPEQLLGKSLRELTQQMAMIIEPVLGRVFATGRAELNVDLEFSCSRPKSENRYGSANFYPVFGSEGKIIGIGVMILDVTERKYTDQKIRRLNIDLKRSNEELERFGAVASHDLREPLRTMTAFLSLLTEKNKESWDQESLEYMNFITSGADRMTALISGLIKLSQLGSQVEEKPVDLNVVIETTLFNLKALTKESGAVVTQDGIANVVGDFEQLVQLFQNLISNGIKYRQKNLTPKIHISMKKKVTDWLICVEDNGIGFEMRDSEKIFDAFQRLHGTSEYSGSGLGLATCRKIVGAHGGRIWAESKLGEGSSFYFTIPSMTKGSGSLTHAEE